VENASDTDERNTCALLINEMKAHFFNPLVTCVRFVISRRDFLTREKHQSCLFMKEPLSREIVFHRRSFFSVFCFAKDAFDKVFDWCRAIKILILEIV